MMKSIITKLGFATLVVFLSLSLAAAHPTSNPTSISSWVGKQRRLRGGEVPPAPLLYQNAVAVGEKKAAAPRDQIFKLGLISGAHVAFGGLFAMCAGGNMAAMQSQNPGLQKLIFGLFGLPLGLYMVLVAGGELFTGNTAFVTAAYIEGKATRKGVAKNWGFSYLGNFIGALLLTKLAVYCDMVPNAGAAATVAIYKTSQPFVKTFLKGILCNWMVCMAVWVASACTTLTEKYLAMILPVTAFVTFGAEHSVANMFLIPYGIMSGARVSWGDFFFKNLLPVTLGNVVGGAVMQTGLYATVYGSLFKSSESEKSSTESS